MVFSSARSDTDKDSARMQMFNAMREQNFEVHMATTMGVQEKCIDIALAVEMMHYATIPDTYDVGGEKREKRKETARKANKPNQKETKANSKRTERNGTEPESKRSQSKYFEMKWSFNPVSYTHLTLPTIYSV